MPRVLDFDAVSVVRDEAPVLDSVTWAVESDERWVVLGPNGAGKSTLMSVAAARTHPTSGTATILGERLGDTDVQSLRSRIGLSSSSLADVIPAGEHVRDVVMTAAYGITNRQREEYEGIDEERTDALLEAFGIAHLAERPFATLSEGERKRAQVARALMPDPEILLLDEPAAGLDLGGREEVLFALTELAGDRRSPTLIFVTHHVEEIPVGFTHLLMLKDGGVHAAGPVDEVLQQRTLSEMYGFDVELDHRDGRWSARRA